jgi:hypothetical protein
VDLLNRGGSRRAPPWRRPRPRAAAAGTAFGPALADLIRRDDALLGRHFAGRWDLSCSALALAWIDTARCLIPHAIRITRPYLWDGQPSDWASQAWDELMSFACRMRNFHVEYKQTQDGKAELKPAGARRR